MHRGVVCSTLILMVRHWTLGLAGVQGSPQFPWLPLPGFCELVQERSTFFLSSPKVIFCILHTLSTKPIHIHTHKAPHLHTEPAFDWLSTMIYFINKDTPLHWEKLSLESRQMFLIRTKGWNIIILLTKTHLDERKPWFKACPSNQAPQARCMS